MYLADCSTVWCYLLLFLTLVLVILLYGYIVNARRVRFLEAAVASLPISKAMKDISHMPTELFKNENDIQKNDRSELKARIANLEDHLSFLSKELLKCAGECIQARLDGLNTAAVALASIGTPGKTILPILNLEVKGVEAKCRRRIVCKDGTKDRVWFAFTNSVPAIVASNHKVKQREYTLAALGTA